MHYVNEEKKAQYFLKRLHIIFWSVFSFTVYIPAQTQGELLTRVI